MRYFRIIYLQLFESCFIDEIIWLKVIMQNLLCQHKNLTNLKSDIFINFMINDKVSNKFTKYLNFSHNFSFMTHLQWLFSHSFDIVNNFSLWLPVVCGNGNKKLWKHAELNFKC